MKTSSYLGLLFVCLCVPALAQPAPPAPFDMSPERPADQPPRPAVPGLAPPANGSAAAVQSAAPAPAANPDARRRYILPYRQLSLSGEMDQRQWSVYLTPEQAQAAKALNIGYQNAVVAAPESSAFDITINATRLDKKSIASPDGEGTVSLPIAPGTLHAGANIITLAAQQRHRTDCTIESTYDLWTDVNPAATYIALNADVGGRFGTLDDIQAIGPDGAGLTAIEIVAPGLGNPALTDQLLRLAQALALRSQMPNQSIRFLGSLPRQAKAGTLTVLAGTYREIAAITQAVPVEALTGAFAGFENNVVEGASTLLISGPTPQALQTAIESVFGRGDRGAAQKRAVFSTKSWHTPEAPLVLSERRIALAELGVNSSEFAGRRYRSSFTVGLPADFYAAAYGEGTFLLDAAYSKEVLPGSRIDIYVNGNIASTVPISKAGGGIFRHFPIALTLRHFMPGVNEIALEAVMMTAADAACLPGATALTTPRFALFDTSEFEMPDFARIGRAPDLAAMGGTGLQMNEGDQPLAVYLDKFDTDTMSAAATLLGRLAMAAGRPLNIETIASPLGAGERKALFVGTLPQMPQALIKQFNLSAAGQADRLDTSRPADQTDALFSDWRDKVSGGILVGQVSSLEKWLHSTLNISTETLRFVPRAEQPYTPGLNINFMLAQGLSPGQEAVWTLATAPDGAGLRDGMAAMAEQKRWGALSGRVAAYDAQADKVNAIAAQQQRFSVSLPWSFWNWRLIAANWLSTNILSYSFVFVGLLTLLGGVTYFMLHSLGRRRR